MSHHVEVGDHVQKTGGDYRFTGIVVSVFAKLGGATRVVVENRDGVLHIFNPSQLVPVVVPDVVPDPPVVPPIDLSR